MIRKMIERKIEKLKKENKIIITSGPTREFFDPIRFLSNPSTGKMGYSIAKAGINQGYNVAYICGPVYAPYNKVKHANNINVVSTQDMLAAVISQLRDNCVLVMAAAPADYRPAVRSKWKLKKTESPSLELIPNPDILKTVGNYAKEHNINVFLVGFAAETHNVDTYAKTKLKEKNLDLIILNDLSRSDSGFGVDTNFLTIYEKDGNIEAWPVYGKERLGYMIIHKINQTMQRKDPK